MQKLVLCFFLVCCVQFIPTNGMSYDNYESVYPAGGKQLVYYNREGQSLSEYLKELVQRVVTEVVQAVDDLKENLDELLDKITDALKHLEEHATAAITKVFDYIDEQIAAIKVVGKCVQDQKEALKNVTDEARAEVKQCVAVAKQNLTQLHSNLTEQRDSILDELNEIRGIIVGCANSSVIQTVVCVRQNLDAIQSSIGEIVTLAKQAVAVAKPQVALIKENTKQCVETARTVAKTKTDAIVKDIKECVDKENEITPYDY